MRRRAILLGTGGHAGVLVAILDDAGTAVEGLVTPDRALHGTLRHGIRVLGDDDAVLQHSPDDVVLVNAIGSVGSTASRREVFDRFKRKGYKFLSLMHPTAIVAPGTVFGEGVQVMARTVVQPGATVGDNSLLNTGVIVEHDCVLGRHVHLATGAVLCGSVRVDDGVHVGAGSVIIQGRRVGELSTVAAGAVVIRDVQRATCVAGVPARETADHG